MERICQLLTSLQWKPLAPTHLILTLQAELTNLDSIYTSYKPLILEATHLLKKGPSYNSISTSNGWTRISLLPFWLMGAATTKDVRSMKKKVNQLITAQNTQQETLVHIISVLNITKYATQGNRQHISVVMNIMERTHQGVTTLYNITHSLYTSLSYQIILHICCSSKSLWFTVLYESSHQA